jgi:ADP-ribose pyrophosphatase YjhB (NUDIX family)
MAYRGIDRIGIAVDCIIFGFNDNNLELLLIHRSFEPKRGKWSLMGGFVKRNEHLDAAAARILRQLTGLDNIYMEQVKSFGKVNRDPEERILSVTYFALIRTDYNRNSIDEHNAKWFPLNKLPHLIFDHKEMVQSALSQLRRKVKIQPIGFNLLPEKFTLPQLQNLYEAILGEDIDKRNFRKKLSGLDLLIKLDEKDKTSSKKGAFLFKFNKRKYNEIRNFSI